MLHYYIYSNSDFVLAGRPPAIYGMEAPAEPCLNTLPDIQSLATAMRDACVAAGELALRYFEHGGRTSAGVSYKDGGSPVSEADLAVDRYLHEHLRALLPQAAWLSEESVDDPARLASRYVFVVDPIDGTRAFIQGDGRWGVAVALVEAGRPRAAVLHMPALAETFQAVAGSGAQLNGMLLRASARTGLAGARLAGPKKALEALDQRGFGIIQEPRVPSLAYRLAMVASGRLDGAMASTDAWDWDIAAADLLVRESGGSLTGLDGEQPRYNQPRPRHGVLAAAGPHVHAPLVAALHAIIPA